MRITTIAVDGFGHFRDTRIEPAPGLTVVRGVNEAGKTTLLAFVRAILFGFERDRYPALAGGRRGGRLEIEMHDRSRFRIERHGERGGQGSLKVFDNRGDDRGDGYLATLLQGVEKRVYQNIFAFGLEELTEFNRLNDDEVAARIYGAGAGTGSVSGLDVEKALEDACGSLFKPGGHNPTINQLLRQVEETEELLRDRNLPAEYGAVGQRLEAVEANLRVIAERYAELGAGRRARQRILDGWTAWLDLAQARADRDDLGDVVAFPGTTLERLGRLETVVEDATTAHERAAQARDRAAAALQAATLDEDALAQRTELEVLGEAANLQLARRKERARTDGDLAATAARVADSVGHLGPGWTIERVESFDDSVAVHAEIDGRFRALLDRAAEAVAAAGRELATVEGRATDVAAEAATLDARISELDATLAGRPPVVDRERALRGVESILGRLEERRAAAGDRLDRDLAAERVAQDRRARDARALAAALETQQSARDLLAGMAAPTAADASFTWQRWAGPLVVGGLGIVAAVSASLAGSTVVAIVVAAAALLVAAAWAVVARRPVVSPLAAVREQLESRAADAAATIARLGSALDLGATPSSDAVNRFLAVLDEVRRALDRELDREQRADAAAREAAVLETRLAEAAAAIGLPSAPTRGELDALGARLAADRETEARRASLLEQQSRLRMMAEGVATRRHEAAAVLAARVGEQGTAVGEWRAWLEAHGIDHAVDRETASRIVDKVSAAKGDVAALRTLEGRRDALRSEDAAFAAQVDALAALLPEGHRGDADALAAARLLGRRLAAAIDGQQARAALARTLADRSVDLEEAGGAAERATGELAAFLAGLGAADGDALRTEVERSARADALDEVISAATRTLTTLSGPGEALAAFVADLQVTDDVELVRDEVADLDARLTDLVAERDELNGEAGGLRSRRENMERDAEATEVRQRRADLQARLEAAAERWTVHALAADLLARARAAYEEAHRPAVVQAAERHFAEWTGGRYRRIVAPLGSSIESVERANGDRVALAALSRGTAEQLYLALRFGLVERFVETSGEPLPIVMDDILVNFDDDRAARAARSIEALAGSCQVMYFTCHPTTPLRAEVDMTLSMDG